MKQRILVMLAWGLWVLSLAMLVCAAAVSSRSATSIPALLEGSTTEFSFSAFAAVGALITTRKPGNRIGWIFSAIGVGTAFTSLDAALSLTLVAALQHTQYAPLPPLVTPQVVTLTDLLSNLAWSGSMLAFMLLLLIFPTGRLLSPRWRVVAWVMVGNAELQALLGMMDPHGIAQGRLANPLDSYVPLAALQVANAVFGILLPLLILGLVVAMVVALVVRFRRARGVERQQLKWFTYGALATLVLSVLASALTPSGSAAFGLAILVLPITVAISILRYRLFDIDVIINQTLVYGSLTALLAGVYVGSVLAMQHLAIATAGRGAGDNPLILVVSTLLIAALFQPLRVRLQRTIDRRFYRQKYDAAKTLARFAATLRGEVDLADLQGHLMGVVEETLQPAHVSLWIATPSAPVARNL